MKKYISPKIKVCYHQNIDVITTSSQDIIGKNETIYEDVWGDILGNNLG